MCGYIYIYIYMYIYIYVCVYIYIYIYIIVVENTEKSSYIFLFKSNYFSHYCNAFHDFQLTTIKIVLNIY